MKHVIVGAGEVGQALFDVLRSDPTSEVTLRDVEGLVFSPIDFLHISFPHSYQFDSQVMLYEEIYNPSLTIIHSTVPVGTSSRLGAVHSPISGRHRTMYRDIHTFTKFFGGPLASRAAEVFSAVGVKTFLVKEAETTEAGKLWQTLQYGWLIALEKEIYRFCAEKGADYEVAYRLFNEAYNVGHERLDRNPHLPIMEHVEGAIGGHCVIENLALTPSALSVYLEALNGTWAREAESKLGLPATA